MDARQTTLICYDKPTPIDPPPNNSCYPLAPNICVEAGRIQFVRRDSDGGGAVQSHQNTQARIDPPPSQAQNGTVSQNTQARVDNAGFEHSQNKINGSTHASRQSTIDRNLIQQHGRVTVTRGLQTEWEEDEEEADLREVQVGAAPGL